MRSERPKRMEAFHPTWFAQSARKGMESAYPAEKAEKGEKVPDNCP
jgi:hypothetical protein